jgi:hypothetical protein
MTTQNNLQTFYLHSYPLLQIEQSDPAVKALLSHRGKPGHRVSGKKSLYGLGMPLAVHPA